MNSNNYVNNYNDLLANQHSIKVKVNGKLLVKQVPIRADFNFSSLCDIESSPKYTQNEIKNLDATLFK